MIAGLAFQVISITAFDFACADFAFRVSRRPDQLDPKYAAVRQSRKFTGFLYALAIATLAIYIRSIFRVAELSQGLTSKFANNEVTFMVLEAGMITIAAIMLIAFQPALVFGNLWQEISGDFKNKNGNSGRLEDGQATTGQFAKSY